MPCIRTAAWRTDDIPVATAARCLVDALGQIVPLTSLPPLLAGDPAMSAGHRSHPGTLAQASANDSVALTEARLADMYHSQRHKLYRFLRRSVGDDAAGDLVHEAFLRLADSRKTHLLAEPVAYLWTVTRNLLFERSRREQRATAAGHRAAAMIDPVAAPEQEWGLEAADLLRAYQQAVDSLPEKTRRVFMMRRIDERSHHDIAAELGISMATVEYHMGRALSQIARMVDAAQ